MKRNRVAASLLILLVAVAVVVGTFRHDGPPITGRWQAEAPGSLVFEFSSGGVVSLVDGAEARQVFRYKITNDNTIELYDGMGRIRRFRVAVAEETMTFFDPESGLHVERYSRISNDI